MTYSVVVLLGTARAGCQSMHVANLVSANLKSRENLAVNFVDLTQSEITIMRYRLSDMKDPPHELTQLNSTIANADGIIIVAPEYKNGYPGSLKNALDYLDPQIMRKTPVGIVTVSSGGFGGINCLAQLRLVCLALGGIPMSDKFPVSRVQELFDSDGSLKEPEFENRVSEFNNSFLWFVEAFHNQRMNSGEL